MMTTLHVIVKDCVVTPIRSGWLCSINCQYDCLSDYDGVGYPLSLLLAPSVLVANQLVPNYGGANVSCDNSQCYISDLLQNCQVETVYQT
jgi:hypothetical protein